MPADKDSFSGTFVGEEQGKSPVAKKPTAQQAALAKYTIDPNKPVKAKKIRKGPTFTQIVVAVSGGIVVCIVAGTLLVKLSPHRSVGTWTGGLLLLAAAMFIFALLLVVGRRRR